MGITPTGKSYLNFQGYAMWERQILRKLYDKGGTDGMHAVDYMILNGVHLLFRQQSDTGAMWDIDGNIYLDSDSYSTKTVNDPYMLSLVAHEATHLEQNLYALTVDGELKAWQLQARVYHSLTGSYPSGWDITQLNSYTSMDAWIPGKTLEIRQMFKDYVGGGVTFP